MDIAMASVFFDNDPLYDAYTGDYLYDGQFATYDGSQLDGSFVRRRTVSLAPDLVLPARRVVKLFDEPWVLSDPIRDGFYGEQVRQTMSARKAHGLYGIVTAGELAEGLPVLREAYAFCRWTKNTADAATSNLEPYFEFSFSITETKLDRKFFILNNKIWHSRMATEIAEGFQFAEADLLVNEDEQFLRVEAEKPGKRDPVSLVEAPGSFHKGVVVNRYQFFTKLDQAQENNYHGDKTLIVAKAPELETAGNLKIDGQRWTILAREDLNDGWGLHIRRVA